MQAAWFAAALLASTQWHFIGALGNVVFILAHISVSKNRKSEIKRALLATLIGFFIEQINFHVGQVETRPTPVAWWIISLWPAFATSFAKGNSLHWLARRLWVSVMFGAILGPIGYFGGARLGALDLNGIHSAFVLAVTWAIGMPFLATLQQKLFPASAPL
jgi:hypothetical protein